MTPPSQRDVRERQVSVPANPVTKALYGICDHLRMTEESANAISVSRTPGKSAICCQI